MDFMVFMSFTDLIDCSLIDSSDVCEFYIHFT